MQNKTFLLGVTGGIGSGKSTVCTILEELGAKMFYADKEAARIMEKNTDVRDAVRQAFGISCYAEDGSLNREFLADQVFGNNDSLSTLNGIVHPHVYDEFRRSADQAGQSGTEALVLEAAVLFESGGAKHLDAVAVVEATRENRLRRAARRDKINPEQIRARMEHQLSPDDLHARADYVIDNNGTPEELRNQVEALWKKIRRMGNG